LLFSILIHQKFISFSRKYYYKTRRHSELSGFASGAVEVYILGSGAASLGNLFKMFQDNIAVSFSRAFLPLKKRKLHCLNMSGTSYPMMQPLFQVEQ
jgi:hypothetical protein